MTTIDEESTLNIRRTSGDQATTPQEKFQVGIPERAVWPARQNLPEQFTAEQVPGGGHTTTGGITGIIVALDVQECYVSEDGMSFGLGADEGYVWTATIRAATEVEAAPVLEAERAQEAARTLSARVRSAFAWRGGDAERGAVYDLPLTELTPATAHPVPQAPTHGYTGEPAAELLVDQKAGLVWTLSYNGLQGDDHARSNWGSWIAIRHPLTDERARLIEEMNALYATDDDWRAMGITPQAQRVLIEAGWTLPALERVEPMRLVDVADAHALMDHSPQWWTEHDWSWLAYRHAPVTERWTVTQALELIEGGLTHRQAHDLRALGHTTVTDALTAAAPTAPADATRIELVAPHRNAMSVWVDSAQALATYLERREAQWGWQVRAQKGPQVVHVAPTRRGNRLWMLWDDHRITTGWWHGQERPQELTRAAAQAVTLAVQAQQAEKVELWRPMLAAQELTVADIDQAEEEAGLGMLLVPHLRVYRFALTDSAPVTWWVASTEYVSPDGDEEAHRSTIHTERQAAEQELEAQLEELRERWS